MPATLADIRTKDGDSVFPLYKGQEPFMEDEGGIGYKGVVLIDEHEKKIQCSECGEWFKTLSNHLPKHQIKAREYKQKHGLNQSTPLCTPEMSRVYRENVMAKPRLTNVKPFRRGHRGYRKKYTMQLMNKKGLCDAQIIAQLLVCYKQAGTLSKDIVAKHNHRLAGALYERQKHGGKDWDYFFNELKLMGVFSRRTRCDFVDADLIAKLRNYVEEKRVLPSFSNKMWPKTLPSISTYLRYFGSWNRAKMMAGLDQLLAEIKCTSSQQPLAN